MLFQRIGGNQARCNLPAIELPNCPHARPPSIRRSNFSFDFVARSEPSLCRPSYFVFAAVFAQRSGYCFPIFDSKSDLAEKSSFARAIGMSAIEQVIHNLLSLDD